MTHDTYKYRFDESVPAQELEDTFLLAMLAVESLHGRSRVRMESRFNLDKARRTCVIDASTDVGSDLARIFTGFATKEYGERSVLIERTQPSGCACAHERDSQAESGRDDLRAQLDSRNTLVAEQQTRIDDLLTERVKLFDELAAKDRDLKNALQDNAALEAFRDSFLRILEERDSRLAEAQRRIDALMLAARPHLGAGRDMGQEPPADPPRTEQRHLPLSTVDAAPTWHFNLATEPFGLPTVPKAWHGDLKLRLLDDFNQLTFRIDSFGAGAYCQLKSNAIFDPSEADFVAPLMNGLIQIMNHLFPHLTASYPNATPTEARA